MKVIAISGKAGSGKTSLANGLLDNLDQGKRTVIVKFADPIYDIQESIQSELNQSQIKDRPLMIDIADLVKGRYGEEIFTEVLINTLRELEDCTDYVIIDDMRFGHELDKLYTTVEDLITVRLEAPEHVLDQRVGVKADRTHISETDLDNSMFDLYIDVNDKDQKQILKEVLNEIN